MKLKLYFLLRAVKNDQQNTYGFAWCRIYISFWILNTQKLWSLIKRRNIEKIIWFSTFFCGVELMFSVTSETQWHGDKQKQTDNKEELNYQ